MTRNSRILAYGSAGALIVAGGVCGGLVSGETGEVLALVLIGLGLVGIVGLAFMEVGLSEDRERERERRARERAERPKRPRRERPGLRLGRMRGERRRLR